MTYKVLLVDDHALVREGIAMLISREQDLTVCGEAEDAPAALSLITQEAPDLVIVDLDLRTSSGLDLIRQVRAMQPEVKILVLSVQDERIYAERALRAGARGFVMKSEGSQKVIEAIRAILEGKTAFSEAVNDQLLLQRMGNHTGHGGSPAQLLSDRELQVFRLTGDGLTTHQIAQRLNVSRKTVYKHVERIKEKLHIRSSRELVQRAAQWVVDPNRKESP